jgi:hypothetical protein
MNTPTNETHIKKIDVKELINFLKNNLGDEVSELGLINELQSNTADLSDDKPKNHINTNRSINEADTSFVIITNKLMNGFQRIKII